MGRKAFEVTPEMHARVKTLAAYGAPEDGIAKIIGCPIQTLRRRFRLELKLGPAEANAQAAGQLFVKARGGDLAAIIFWLKTHGWVTAARKKAAAGAKATAAGGTHPVPPIIIVPHTRTMEDVKWAKPVWAEAVARYEKRLTRQQRQAQREFARQQKLQKAAGEGQEDEQVGGERGVPRNDGWRG